MTYRWKINLASCSLLQRYAVIIIIFARIPPDYMHFVLLMRNSSIALSVFAGCNNLVIFTCYIRPFVKTWAQRITGLTKLEQKLLLIHNENY